MAVIALGASATIVQEAFAAFASCNDVSFLEPHYPFACIERFPDEVLEVGEWRSDNRGPLVIENGPYDGPAIIRQYDGTIEVGRGGSIGASMSVSSGARRHDPALGIVEVTDAAAKVVVTDGGVIDSNGYFGYSEAIADVRITGPTSRLEVSSLGIGGTWRIENGASVVGDSIHGSPGSLTVSTGASLTEAFASSDTIFHGTQTVFESGATGRLYQLVLDDDADLEVSGANTSLELAVGPSSRPIPSLSLGVQGKGSASIRNGANVTTLLDLAVASAEGGSTASHGVLTVGGVDNGLAPPSLDVDRTLRIGTVGRGELIVSNTGKVAAGSGQLGGSASSSYSVSIGTSSEWIIEGFLNLDTAAADSELIVAGGTLSASAIWAWSGRHAIETPGGRVVTGLLGVAPDAELEVGGATMSTPQGVPQPNDGPGLDLAGKLTLFPVTQFRANSVIIKPGAELIFPGGQLVADSFQIDSGAQHTTGPTPNVVTVLSDQFAIEGAAVIAGDGAWWSTLNYLTVSGPTGATLTVRDAAELFSGAGQVGRAPGSGTVEVLCSSRWTNSGNLDVGVLQATGTVSLQRATTSIGDKLRIGGLGGEGHVKIVGPVPSPPGSCQSASGASADNLTAKEISIAAAGDGQLEITDGGKASAERLVLGGPYFTDQYSGPSGARGRLSMTGSASRLVLTGDSGAGTAPALQVGGIDSSLESLSSDQQVLVADGAAIVLGTPAGLGGKLTVGSSYTTEGRVLIDGPSPERGTAIDVLGEGAAAYIGHGGKGSMEISGGGHLRVHSGNVAMTSYVGNDPFPGPMPSSSDGRLGVHGSGSRASFLGAGRLTVAQHGTGRVDITDGGELLSNQLQLAESIDSQGVVAVDGTDSLIDLVGDVGFIGVGNAGSGEVRLTGGASIQARTIHLGRAASGTGTFDIDGTDGPSRVMLEQGTNPSRFGPFVRVGSEGSGTLNILGRGQLHIAGASLDSPGFGIGRGASADGTITVSDESLIRIVANGGFQSVAYRQDAKGRLDILNGSIVESVAEAAGDNLSRAYVASYEGADGTVVISGYGGSDSTAPATWRPGRELYIGYSASRYPNTSQARVTVETGGWLAVSALFLGAGGQLFERNSDRSGIYLGTAFETKASEYGIGAASLSLYPGLQDEGRRTDLVASALLIDEGGTFNVSDRAPSGSLTGWTKAEFQRIDVWAGGTLALNGGAVAAPQIEVGRALASAPVRQGDARSNGHSATTFSSARLSGSGSLEGALQVHGIAAPGGIDSSGALRIDGTAGLRGELLVDISGPSPESEHDVLEISGAAVLDGRLQLNGSNASALLGHQFRILDASNRVGEFASIDGIALEDGIDLAVCYVAKGVLVSAVLRGDVNADGVVDVSDSERVMQNQGLNSTAYCAGDINGDGQINARDAAMFDAEADAQPVPLPLSALLAFALLLYACRPPAAGRPIRMYE